MSVKSLLLVVVFFSLTFAQMVVDSTDVKVTPDSLVKKKKKAKRVTLTEVRPLFDGMPDTSQAVTFKALETIGYQGVSDLFRTNPEIQIYDFLEMGMPRFASALHLWPEQTSYFKNDFLLNDPLNGRYNTRFVFPDGLAWVASAPWNGNYSFQTAEPFPAIYLQSRFILQEEPYTRIMYREGDFAYTDLDITFARQFNSKTALQLGGVNRDYALNYYRGMHYRGQLIHLLNPKMLFRFFYHKSSENVNFLDYFATEYGRFRYNEVRENLRARLFFLDDSQKVNGQIDASFENSRRKYVFAENGLRMRLRFDRYSVALTRTLQLGPLPLFLKSGLRQVKAWGSSYSRKYTDTEADFSGQTRAFLFSLLHVSARLGLQGLWGYALQPNSLLAVKFKNNRMSVGWQGASFARFPTINERFLTYQGLNGLPGLQAERHFNSTVDLRLKLFPWSSARLGLTWRRINDEILFSGKRFYNGQDRNFSYIFGRASFKYLPFVLTVGGQSGLGGTLIGPDYSAFAHLRYAGRWYQDRVLIRASGTLQWSGPSKKIAYQPYAESFYLIGGKWPQRLLIHYKISATIKDAIFFMEMDNALGEQYQIIRGYPELYRRVRFGLSWVLWN
ncbi:hypothetical protein [Caldithrix abyssi]